jgi:hypothetical protein
MANVSITEFQGVGFVAPAYDGMSFKVPAQAPFYSLKTTVEQALMTAQGTSPAFNQYTNLVRVHTDAPIKLSIAAAPSATVNSPRLAANQTEYFCVTPGDKISWVTSA